MVKMNKADFSVWVVEREVEKFGKKPNLKVLKTFSTISDAKRYLLMLFSQCVHQDMEGTLVEEDNYVHITRSNKDIYLTIREVDVYEICDNKLCC